MVCSFSVFFFKQKTAYEMRISDWSSDVCSSDLLIAPLSSSERTRRRKGGAVNPTFFANSTLVIRPSSCNSARICRSISSMLEAAMKRQKPFQLMRGSIIMRSEEHTSELQSLMRISYAVFCLKKKKQNNTNIHEVH